MSELAIIEQRLANVEREVAELKQQSGQAPPPNPWLQMAGMFADDPLYDEWRQAMEDYRRRCDEDNGDAE